MPKRIRMVRLLAVVCLGFLIHPATVAAQTSAAADQAPALLDDGWQVAAPSEAGFDPGALAAISARIESDVIRNVHAVVVEHDGRLVYERYFTGEDERWGRPVGWVSFDRDSLHDLRSVTKSVTTALVGIALGGDYQAAIERPIVEYFDDLEGPFGTGVEDITLSHVLTMTAGLEWEEIAIPYTDPKNDETQLNRSADPTGMVLGRPVRDPVGSRWTYNGGLTHVLGGLIQRVTGKRLEQFAEETLFGPLGITKFEWRRASVWGPDEPPSTASGLRLRARDLAKIGSLYLHGGVWKGRQVIPAEWVDLSTQRHVRVIPFGREGNIGYGFMWYSGQTRGEEGYRVVAAMGNGGQRIFIVPEKGIVVTVFAGNYNKRNIPSGDEVFAKVLDAWSGSN